MFEILRPVVCACVRSLGGVCARGYSISGDLSSVSAHFPRARGADFQATIGTRTSAMTVRNVLASQAKCGTVFFNVKMGGGACLASKT